MPDLSTNEPRAIHTREWRWLRTEADAWVRDGLIDEPLRDRILGRYHVDTAATERRGLAILSALAGLAAAIAVLLLIGYNWDVIPRTVKVVTIFGAVAAAFAGSFVAYSRGRTSGGEQLAFLGTLFYGNAIWLLAQVFHISGRYPDGALWWAIGALVGAYLLTSRLIAFQAVVIVGVWLVMETMWITRPPYLYLLIGPAAIWLAYHVRSRWVLALALLTIVYWISASAGIAMNFGTATLGLVVLTGAAFYAASRLHRPGSSFENIWQGLGLTAIAVCLAPLMFHRVHSANTDFVPSSDWPLLAVVPIAVGIIVSVAMRVERNAIDVAVWIVSALTAAWVVWSLAAGYTAAQPAMRWATVLAFSGATLFMGITLMRSAMSSGRGGLFATGVVYILLFLMVRWIDLLGSMVWSALFLLAVAGFLFWMTRLWRKVRS